MTNQTSRAKTDAHHKEVAEAIIKMIEGGTAPWQKPWDGNASAMATSMPFNGASKRRYRGINSLYLYTVANFKGYKDPRWFTFKQVEELGGKVKRGEKSVKVEYWQFKRTIKEDENGKPLAKEDWLEVDRKVPLIMRSAVFNAEQCEGIPELELPKRDWEPLERADTIMKAVGVPIFHDAVDRNYYSHGKDEIHLTPMEAFPTREAYYGTALHELGHSTGHEKRLNRQFGKTFGDENYAKEELRAEIASFMLCSDLGISRQASDEQHAAYVGSWIKALKSDPNEIFKASADAENICNYLYDREREYMKNLGNEIEPNVPNNSVNYPEIVPSVTKVAEQAAGYGVPNDWSYASVQTMVEPGVYRKVDAFYDTAYRNTDGERLATMVIDGKSYLGVFDERHIRSRSADLSRLYEYSNTYYDDSGSVLLELSDNPKIAEIVSGRSFQHFEGGSLDARKFSVTDFVEADGVKEKFLNNFILDASYDDNDFVVVNRHAISNFSRDGKELNVFVINDAVYLGERENYNRSGVYDDSGRTLMKVSDNVNMFHMLRIGSTEQLYRLNLDEADLRDYAELKKGVLAGLQQHHEIVGLEDLASGFYKDDSREIDAFFSTNYVSRADGSCMNVYVVDGKTYLGKSQNVMLEDGVDEAGRSVTHRYYDNADGSLIYLSDKAKMATFLADRSYGLPQDRMSNIGSYDFDDVLEAQHHEISRLFLDYSFAKDRLPELNDNLIKINSAAISNFEFDGKQLNVFVKDDAVYVGLRERYFTRGVYDNSDYTLMKVSDNRKMFHLLQGTGYVDSQEKMIAQELFSERDFIEYAELKAGALKKFEQVRELTFDGVPFKSPLAENEPVKGAAEMDKGKVDYLHAYHTNFAENGERKSTFIMDGKAYLGNYKNIKMEPGKDDVGNDVMVRYYDNTDGSLIHLSDKPEMASFIAERSFDIYQDSMADLGKFTLEDAREAERLESTVLSGYDEWSELPPRGMDDSLIVIDGAKPSNYVRDGKEQIAFVKNYEVYLGDASRYNGERVYDNSDYSLVKVSSNVQMYHVINGLSEGATREELISSGAFSVNDFVEYDEMRGRILEQFDEVVPNLAEAEMAINAQPLSVDIPEAELNAALVDEAGREVEDNPYEGMTEVVEFVQTNFEKDGKRINIVNMNGELYLGYDDNCKLNVVMGDEPQSNKIISYYDNRDDSLDYLTDRVHMAQFIRGMSYGYSQDQMLNASGGYNLGAVFSSLDYEEYEYHESRTFSEFNRIDALLDGRSDTDINLNYVGKFDYTARDGNMLGGKELEIFEKSGSFYVGDADNYDVFEGTYDNSDYTLFKVTDKLMVMELVADNEIDVKAGLESGNITHADLQEYFLFNERTSEIFVPNFSNKVINDRARLLSDDYVTNFPRIDSHIIPANLADRVILTSKEGTFVGKRQNMLFIHGAKYYGEKIYDNRDGSLVKLSDNSKMAELISDRAFGFNIQTIMEVREGEFTVKDFEEYNKIYDEYLSKLEFTSTYEDMGRFDIKEAMKMADEQVNGQVNEAAKEFNPPSDAQLALAESLHCKYKEDVSREELAKIIAKTMEARKKYYEAINQPAKETQLDVLKEAGIEVKDGLTIGQASKMIAELPASTNQKVFMDRLKIEYAPDITRGEVEKLIKGKMKELEARENEPASEKTREFMKNRGIEVPEKLTRAEASKLIYNSAPTAKQMAFITNHKIECDKEKLTYGKASILIDKRLKYIDEQAKLPATEKQIKRLEKEKIEFAPEITRGEANKLINKAVMEKLQVSEKQIKYANDLGLEIPENATKAEVTKLIGEKVKANRIDKIADFEVPKDRKLTLSEGYYKLAQKYLEKGKEIDDKKIAASLLKDGHRDCDVKSVIHKNSPNCVNDLSKAQGYVNEAKKLPSVKKALEKENSR